ncbi:uncharacterized protein [Miscanthus floridulus]|uniref:uncharacterized protein isoform X1 n=1 Tax=Miscanthus floridulus TaxID=154761 RepID=UPI0034580F72
MDYQGDKLRDFFQSNGHQVLQRVENNYSLKYFTENEIRNITNGYKYILGRGAFGEVYKGTLEDQTSVAVKKYIHGTQKELFAKEVIVHSQINHKNVVRLLGCCTEKNSLMIVMEFITNGNLNSILHGNSANGQVPFPLEKRIEIAIGVAEALLSMHSMYSPVLHGDIKPANILLDKNFTPKISDFGIARLLCANGPQQTTTIIGSIGYLDPAYCESGILTPKSDVYSFGVVLLEVITRKKAVDGTITLAQSFNEALTKGEDVQHMFDGEISVAENKKFLGDIGQLAAKCLQRDVKTRPEIVEVASNLRMIRKAMQIEQENLSQQRTVWTSGHQFGNLKNFNKIEMKRMTKNYRMTFRKESCECLYNGVLDEDRPVIVRQLKTCSDTDREMFLNTMSILSQKNHKNIANVVGFHLGKSILECVYESFCDLSESKFGSLSLSNRNLYDTICSIEKIPLHQRLSIAVQCAEGLVHIHSLVAESPDLCGSSLLGNFRSVNIFLDKNFVPKIFNWNLSTFLGHSTVQNAVHDNGREYYSDPRDVSSQLFNLKSDVYSFGVVLLELITWKTVRYKYDGRVHVLTTDFIHSYRTDHGAIEIFGKVYDEQGKSFIHEAIAIAVDCLQPHIEKRPEMNVVLSRLRIIASAQSIRSKLTAGDNNKSSQHTVPATVSNTAKLHLTLTLTSTISLEELNEVTRNFSIDLLIGQGSYARTFLAVLKDGQNSAIKKLDPVKEIQVQVPAILGMSQHDNVVQLLGYFVKEETRVLAYEYAPRGSLYDILHGKKGVKGAQPGPPLSWLQRVKIAVSAAKGLEFLHDKAEPPIIHSSIKSSNILLFDNDVAKIGDIGVSIHEARNRFDEYYETAWVSRDPKSAWEAPECAITGVHSRKSDVYSFGIVLLELLTGRKVIDNTMPRNQRSLVTWATPRLSEDKVEQCIDPRLGGGYPLKAVSMVPILLRLDVVCSSEQVEMAAVAALCLQWEPDYRPEMNIVVRALCRY